ncbi:MAG TPA: hypothetical protein VEG65_04875 [Candidatus Bathyarchaeia archaeon]|nr:hypothetical protein [Candidatus Bathyarchaeia archaeon]
MVREVIIHTVKDALAAGSTVIESAQRELVWLLPPNYLDFSFQYRIPDKSKALIERGGRVRGITRITEADLEQVHRLLDNGEELRHIDQFPGPFLMIGDDRDSISSMNVNAERLQLDDPTVAFWTDNKAQAEFLKATFESVWNNAVDAKKRLQEL